MHDAAHVMAAYPGGISSIKQTVQWQDLVAQRYGGQDPEARSDEERSTQRPSVRHGRFLNLIVIRVLLMAVPAVFLISMMPLSLLFVVVPTTRLPWLASLSFTVPLGPAGMLATPAANRRRPVPFRSLVAEPRHCGTGKRGSRYGARP